MGRQQLQADLQALLGSSNVYFQPPESVKMQYPCIVYQRDNASTIFADDHPYRHTQRYQVTVIDRNPDSEIPDKVAKLPMTTYNRFFAVDGLNHDVFVMYY